MPERTLSPAEERSLTLQQKEYLRTHPSVISLQPHSMLPVSEQLYQTMRHGAVTIARAIELDAVHDNMHKLCKLPDRSISFDGYSNAEDSHIDRHGVSIGLF